MYFTGTYPQDPLYLELIYLAYVICISFDSPAKQEQYHFNMHWCKPHEKKTNALYVFLLVNMQPEQKQMPTEMNNLHVHLAQVVYT